jgi:hypothetical protein
MCGHVVLRTDGVSREGATCWCPGSGVRQPVPLPPPGRNRCGPSAAASTVTSAGRCAGGHRPVRRPRCGQRVSDTPAASPSGVRIRAAQRPSAMAALGRTRRRGVQQPGRVDRWADTPTRTVPARQTCGAVSVRPAWPPRRWGGRRRNLRRTPRTVPPLPSVVAVQDSGHRGQRAAARHGLPPGATATGTGRRGGGRWSDVASADRRGRAGRSAGRGAGCDRGHRRPGERAGLLKAEVVDLHPGDLAVLPAGDDRLGDLLGVDARLPAKCPWARRAAPRSGRPGTPGRRLCVRGGR